jgi:hypothetical protein
LRCLAATIHQRSEDADAEVASPEQGFVVAIVECREHLIEQEANFSELGSADARST